MMASKEFEQHLEKVAQVKAELKKLEAAAKKAEKAEKAKSVEEPKETPNAIEAKDIPQDKKSSDKKKGEIFESHPHLDVSPGLHTVELDQAA